MTYLVLTVEGSGRKKEDVRFLIDSGASYSVLPEAVWKRLKLKPKRTMAFTLADGAEITRDISECRISSKHGDGHTPVVLGQRGDKALLGAVTLEILGLVLNPFTRELQPMQMMLA